MKAIKVWYHLFNNENGDACWAWYLTRVKALEKVKEIDSGVIGFAETFVGSNIHQEAVENSTNILIN